MNKVFVALVVAATAVGVTRVHSRGLSSDAPQSVSACYAFDDYAAGELRFLRRIAVNSTGRDSIYRARVKLPAVTDTAAVYVVTDSATCAAAVGPHNQYAQYSATELSDPASQRVYLIRAGSVLVASNPMVRGSDTVPQFVMDSTYALLASFLR